MTPAPDLVARLLSWYGRAARDLPWRAEPSPYHVLLSELMLQQTRVETVIPYYERFLARWPTLADLAAAPLDDVLQAWAGLGYYRRARNLHRCARLATERGGLPRSAAALAELPGVGPYTSGAIASIAFGERAPLVDGNVERVLCRIDGREEDPRSPAGRRALWARAASLQEALPDDAHPGDLNQALMELGATVCTPRSPRCLACPAQEVCRATVSGDAEALPRLARRRPPKPMHAVCGLLGLPGGILLGRRPRGLLGGLWEPVCLEVDASEDAATAVRRAFRERAGLEVRPVRHLGDVVHVFTHRRLTCRVWAVEADGPVAPRPAWYTELRPVDPPDTVALSKLARKLLALHEPPRP